MSTVNPNQPYQFDGGQVGAFERETQQLFNASGAAYNLPPNPQLVQEALGTGLSSSLVNTYNQQDPQYQSLLTSSPIGQAPAAPDYNSLSNSLSNSVSPTSIYSFNQDQYLAQTKHSLGNDSSLAALGENPIPNVGYFTSLASASPDRIKKYQDFLVGHGLLDPKSEAQTYGTWDSNTAESMRQYMVARFLPDALYGNATDKTNTTMFLGAIGTTVTDLINQNNHGTGQDFQKQVFMDWLRTQDPQNQRDALSQYVDKYGKSSVPDNIANMAGGGILDGLGDALSGFFHNPLGIPIVSPLVGDVVSKVTDPIGNLFQVTRLHRPSDIFEDTRQVKANDIVSGLSSQDQQALAGVQQQVAHSMGWLGVLDGYERFRVQALYGAFYNLSQVFSQHQYQNPFDPGTATGLAALRAGGDIIGGNDPVSTALRNAGSDTGMSSFLINLVTDPLTFIPPAKALKVAGKTALLVDRALPIGSKPLSGLTIRGYELSRPAIVAPGQYTWVGRSILPFTQTAVSKILGDKLKQFYDKQGTLDVLNSRQDLIDTEIQQNNEFHQQVTEYADRIAQISDQYSRETSRINQLTPDSPEVKADLAKQRYARGLDKPPTLAMTGWNIHTGPDTEQLAEVETLSLAEQDRLNNMVANEFKGIPRPTSVPHDVMEARHSAMENPSVQDPYHALMEKLFTQVHDLGGNVRYTGIKTKELAGEGLAAAEKSVADLKAQMDNLQPGDAGMKDLASSYKTAMARVESYKNYIANWEKVTAQSVESGTSRPSAGASLGEVVDVGDATLKKFRDMVFGKNVHELADGALMNEERRLLKKLMDRYQKLMGTTMLRSHEPGRILQDLQDQWDAQYKKVGDWLRAQIVAERFMPGRTVHPAIMDPANYVASAMQQFGSQVIDVDVMKGTKLLQSMANEPVRQAAKDEAIQAQELPGIDTTGRPDLGPISERIETPDPRIKRAPMPNAVDVTGPFWRPVKGESLEDYAQRVANNPDMVKSLLKLRGKLMAVVDPSVPNHGAVLLKLAEDKYNRVGSDGNRTYLITGGRNWGDRPIDRKIMLAAMAKKLRFGDVLVHGGAVGADRMAADIANNELKHLNLNVREYPVTQKEWQPDSLKQLPPITGKESRDRPQFGAGGEEYVGSSKNRRFKYLDKVDALVKNMPTKVPLEQARSLITNKGVRTELLSTIGHDLEVSSNSVLNSALEHVRDTALPLDEFKRRERLAHTDVTAGAKRNQRMIDTERPHETLAFHANIDAADAPREEGSTRSEARGTKMTIGMSNRAGIPHTLYSKLPEEYAARQKIIAIKRDEIKRNWEWRNARFAESHAKAYIAEQRLQYAERVKQRPVPIKPRQPQPPNVDHAAEANKIAKAAALSLRTDNWHARLQTMAHVISSPQVGPDEVRRLITVPDDRQGIEQLQAIKRLGTPEAVMQYLSDDANGLSHNFMDPRRYHIFTEKTKILRAARDGKISNSKIVKFLRAGGIAMTNGDISLVEGIQESLDKIGLMMHAIGIDNKEIATFLNQFLAANDPIARRSLMNATLYEKVKIFYDTDPKLRAQGGWAAAQEWKWQARTDEGAFPHKTVAYAPNAEGTKDLSRGPSSTGDVMMDEQIMDAERALTEHDKMVNAWVASKATKAIYGSTKQTTADFEAARGWVLANVEGGRTLMERFDSQRQFLQDSINELTGGKPQDRSIPAIPSQLQWKGVLPMTPFEAVVYAHPFLRGMEWAQRKMKADWVSSRWKQMVLLRGATSFRIALGDEASRFAIWMLTQGHYLAAAQYTVDQLKGLSKKPVRAIAKIIPGVDAPKWTEPIKLDPHVLWSLQSTFHLMADHTISVFTPDMKMYERAIERMFNRTLKYDPVAQAWVKIFHRDYDIKIALQDARRAYANNDFVEAEGFLDQARTLIHSRDDLVEARAALEATLQDFLGDQEEMRANGTLYDQVARRPDWIQLTKQLRDDPKTQDLLDLLDVASGKGIWKGSEKKTVEAKQKLYDLGYKDYTDQAGKEGDALHVLKDQLEKRGMTTELAVMDSILTSTSTFMVKPRLDTTAIEAHLVTAHKKAALNQLADTLMTPMVREGEVMADGTSIATAEDEAVARKMREMRSINHIELKKASFTEHVTDAYSEAQKNWYLEKFHQLSSILEEMDRRNAAPGEYAKLERRTQEDLGFSVRTKVDYQGEPIGTTKAPAKGTRRIWRVKGGPSDAIITNIDAAREASAQHHLDLLEYTDLPAALVNNWDNRSWEATLPGEAIPGRSDHTIHNQAAKGWKDFQDKGMVRRNNYRAQAHATARIFREKARAMDTPEGQAAFFRKRAEDWAEQTHFILENWTKHPELAKALYTGEWDAKKMAGIIQQDQFADTHILPTIAQPISNLDSHGAFKGTASKVFNSYHEHVTQAMVNYARQTGLLRMQKIFAHEIAAHYGLPETDDKIVRLANAEAVQWMQTNTYQGQRSVIGHGLRNVFPFWGATANMGRFWASILAEPMQIMGHNSHMYPMMPALNFMSRVDQSNQQGGIKIPVKLAHLMNALHMGSSDEITINPAHMFFFTQDGLNSFVPSVGPVMSYGLDYASHVDPHLVDTISQLPLIGSAYSQYINTNGFNPLLGWGAQLAQGASEAIAGKPLYDPTGGLLFGSPQAQQSEILNEQRAQIANTMQGAHDAGQATADLPTEEDAAKAVGAHNILGGVLGFGVPLAPAVTSQQQFDVKNALAAWDQAQTDQEKQQVLGEFPSVAPLLNYFETRDPQLALDNPWIVPYATSKYQHPEGSQFTPTLADFNKDLQAGDIQMDNPATYLAAVRKNYEYSQAGVAYSLLKGQEEQFLRQTGAASTSSLAKAWRANFFYPQLDNLQALYPDWAQTFIKRPGYDQFSRYVESLPLKSLLSYEVIPQADDLNSPTTALWSQVFADIQQTQTGLSDIMNNGGNKIEEQNLMTALDQRLQGYASQDPKVAAMLAQFHFGRVEDLLQAEAI